MGADALHELLRPGLGIVRVAALEQDEEADATEAAADVLGQHRRLQKLGEFHE